MHADNKKVSVAKISRIDASRLMQAGYQLKFKEKEWYGRMTAPIALHTLRQLLESDKINGVVLLTENDLLEIVTYLMEMIAAASLRDYKIGGRSSLYEICFKWWDLLSPIPTTQSMVTQPQK